MRYIFCFLFFVLMFSFVLGEISSSTETQFFVASNGDESSNIGDNSNLGYGSLGDDYFSYFLIAVLIFAVVYVAYRYSQRHKNNKKNSKDKARDSKSRARNSRVKPLSLVSRDVKKTRVKKSKKRK